jgi:hypothetical protein
VSESCNCSSCLLRFRLVLICKFICSYCVGCACCSTYTVVNGELQFSFFNVDSIFDFLLSINMKPLVELRSVQHIDCVPVAVAAVLMQMHWRGIQLHARGIGIRKYNRLPLSRKHYSSFELYTMGPGIRQHHPPSLAHNCTNQSLWYGWRTCCCIDIRCMQVIQGLVQHLVDRYGVDEIRTWSFEVLPRAVSGKVDCMVLAD